MESNMETFSYEKRIESKFLKEASCLAFEVREQSKPGMQRARLARIC
jgi:hypothetical protein